MAERRYKLIGQGLVGNSGFSVGDLSDGNTLYFDGDKWQNTDAITVDPDGPVDLYYDGSKVFETQAGGITVLDAVGDDPFIALRSDAAVTLTEIQHQGGTGLRLRSREHGSTVRLEGEDAGGALRQLVIGDPDGSVDLYYAGSKVFETTTRGIEISVPTFAPQIILERTNNTVNVGIEYLVSDGTNIHAGQGANAEFTISNSANMAGSPYFRFSPSQGAVFGTPTSPTGGFKGSGTLNAIAVYDDNSLLTDYVFDAELDGAISLEKWDRAVPNRRHREEDGEGNIIREVVEERVHAPARRFVQRTDDLDPEAYAAKWRTRRKLPAFDEGDEPVQLSVGDWAQRLLETCEVQAIHIDKLRLRIDELEERLDGQDTTTDR